jgi:hypothetical protein
VLLLPLFWNGSNEPALYSWDRTREAAAGESEEKVRKKIARRGEK